MEDRRRPQALPLGTPPALCPATALRAGLLLRSRSAQADTRIVRIQTIHLRRGRCYGALHSGAGTVNVAVEPSEPVAR